MGLRIVVLDHVTERGGGQLAMGRLADALKPEVDTTFILPGRGPFEERLRAAGHPVEMVPLGEVERIKIGSVRPVADLASRGPGLVRSAWRVAALAHERGAQVIYTNSLKAHVYGAVAARMARLPHVMHVRDILQPPYLPVRLRHSLRLFFAALRPAAVVANSSATARSAPVPGAPVVIPSGITRCPESMPPPANAPPTVAILGRIERWKGHDVAITALARIRRRLPDARLLLGGGVEVGESAYAEELHELAGALGVEDSIEFSGFVDDPYAFFARAHVALHTSVFPEPFGQVVVEAMAVGRPVVATAAGGPLEVLQLGRSGILVPPADPAATADAAVGLLTEPELYERVAEAALVRSGDYTIEAAATKTLQLLRTIT
jgi:glycosyltransferase involved in cell wall biosynthesis